MDNLIYKVIEKLRHYTKTYTDKLDELNIPIKWDLDAEQQYTYVLHGLEYKNYTDKSFLFLAKNVLYRYGFDWKEHNFVKPYVDLINDRSIKPYMIFINGKFIPWSQITVIRDCNYTYFKIDNMYTTRANISCILLPDDIVYNENVDSSYVNSDTYFAFNQDGELDFDFTNPYITIDIPNVYCEQFTISDGNPFQMSLSRDYIVNPKSIFFFNNGYLNYNDDVTNNTNIISINNNLDNNVIVFSNKTKNGEKDNIKIIPNIAYLNDLLKTNNISDGLAKMLERFDFQHSFDKTFSENIANALLYIMQYNPNLMNDVYKELSNIESRIYKGSELLALKDDKNYVSLSRIKNKSLNNMIIIYKNGLLYEGYYTLETVKGREFKFKLMNVADDDIFEFLFITNVDNTEYPLYLYSGIPTNRYNLDPKFDISKAKLFSVDSKDKTFPIKTSSNIQYEIGFEAERVESDLVEYRLKDSWYYDKELTLVSDRQFRYTHIIADNPVGGYLLPKSFRFANDVSKYMIYINGRKIDRENFKITFVSPTRPFTNMAVYFNIYLEIGDTIDIFYLPDKLEETTVEAKVRNNTVILNRDSIQYGLDKDLYLVYLNGKKLTNDQLVEVSPQAILLKNVESKSNLTIIKHVPNVDIIAKVFNDTTDNITSFIESTPEEDRNRFYDNKEIIESDLGLCRKGISNKAVIYEIINDYYNKPYIDSTNLFVYDYEQDEEFIKDKDGNIIFNLNTLE